MKISVFGLGKLGAPMAACFASKGHEVIGVDVNLEAVRKVNAGIPPVDETDLDALFRKNKKRLKATADFQEAVLATDLSFVIVPTPSKPNGAFRNDLVLDCMKKIGGALRKKRDRHLVVLSSTVLPGSMEKVIRPALEKSSGKKCGRDFGLCYNPEFIALGSVIHDILNPDFILIGESDKKSGDKIERFYRTVCGKQPTIARMNWVNAELSKISVNTFITTKISYANMLAEMCEKIPGADVDVVTDALGSDSRIGHKYLKGALGYGGPCFPRDNVAFYYLASRLGANAIIPRATDAINRRQASRLACKILAVLPKKGTVGILGLAYKQKTSVIECSQGIELAKLLVNRGVKLSLFDPLAMAEARKCLGEKVFYASSMIRCIQESDVLVITTPCAEFKKITTKDLRRKGRRRVVIDCWRILDRERFREVSDYRMLGTGEHIT